MKFFNRQRGKSGYFESIVLTLLYLAAGYYFSPADPCLVHMDIPVITIFLALVTLYHGLGAGVVSLLLIGAVMKHYYLQFDIALFLSQFVLVLIYGEFHYYWHRIIDEKRYKLDYLDNKFDEMVKAFYALKISHDQLEKMYVIKPMSLRSALEVILGKYKEKTDQAYAEFLLLLQKSYSVQTALLARLEDETLKPLAVEGDLNANYDDPLVQKALEKKNPAFIADDPHANSSYMAVIPGLQADQVKWLLMIGKMPFLSYNKDTLITIAILMQYFCYQMQKKLILRDAKLPAVFNEEFSYELQRLSLLEKEFHVNSMLLVFKTKDPLLYHLLDQKVRHSIRLLEIPTGYFRHGLHYMAILFPLVDDAAVEGFVARIKESIAEENLESLTYATFRLNQRKLFLRYMGIEDE
ncbi:PelD GGDEF domain-containing protein [Hydrogenimonas sp.]